MFTQPENYSEFTNHLREIFSYLEKIRKEFPILQSIQNPRIPSAFSENMIRYLLEKKIILMELGFTDIKLDNHNKADIVAMRGDSEISIEIKATGKNNFQYFGEKDVLADYIIWIDFGDLFENSAKTAVDIFIIEPQKAKLRSRKIDLKRLKKHCSETGYCMKLVTIDLKKIGLL